MYTIFFTEQDIELKVIEAINQNLLGSKGTATIILDEFLLKRSYALEDDKK